MDQGLSWPQVVTPIVAGAALALSIVSIGLQWFMWHRSGPVVRVRCSHAYVTHANMAHAISVTATNIGRSSTQISSWWLEEPGDGTKWTMMHLTLPGSTDLPAVIEGHSEAHWLVGYQAVEDSQRERGVSRVRPVVSLGSGKKVAGPWFDLG